MTDYTHMTKHRAGEGFVSLTNAMDIAPAAVIETGKFCTTAESALFNSLEQNFRRLRRAKI
ncbi:MAG: hypothetical protein OXQ92_08955 [Boseongicola sp.]|nr:hypothetical protein [Boseongicola sp.]MDD9977079.1 hypothetical protein [Boseongicola sp.]